MIEIVQRIVHDPVTLGVVVAFWIRWERWRAAHLQQHRELQALVPHEVTDHG